MANPTVTFILGILTTLVVAAGVYIYIDFTRSNTTVANYSASKTDSDTYIYDQGDKVMKDAIDQTISDSLDSESTPTQLGVISGVLCYPSSFLPEGLVVAKNIETDATTTLEVDGTKSDFKIQVEPGTYHLRYQAYASGDANYTSGYYTKCGIDSSVEVCDKDDGHELISVSVTAGKTTENIRLCDFYYSEEPEF